MIIESLIKRKAGTTVKLGDLTYFFNATETEPRHLCEVKDAEHIARLLSVKEGFREAEGKKKANQAQAADKNSEQTTANEASPVANVTAPAAETVNQPAAESTIVDRDTLLAEAKALKIKSAHLFGNEKLIAAIAEAKA